MLEIMTEFALGTNDKICLIAFLFIAMFFAGVSLVNILALAVHVAVASSIYILAVIILIKTNIYLCVFFVVLVSHMYMKRSIHTVPSRPASAGLIKILGRKTETYCKDGTKFYPPSPLFSIEVIDIQPFTIECETDVVLPDGSKARLPSKLTVSPNIKHLRTYINKGEVAGVKKILASRIEPVLRIWASSDEEGPADWREARAAGADITARIARPLLGKCLEDIPSEIPTPCLLRYFAVPQPKPNKRDSDQFGPKWEKLTAILNLLDPKALKALKDSIAYRRKQIFDLSQVQGNFEEESLGVDIHGYSLGRIQILGGVEEAAASKVREQEEGQGSIAEFRIDMEKAQELMKEVNAIPGAPPMMLDRAYKQIAEQRAVKESRSSQAIIIPDLTESLSKILEILEKSKK